MKEAVDGIIEVCVKHKKTGYRHFLSGKLVTLTPEEIRISQDFLRETYTEVNGKRIKNFVDTTEVSVKKLSVFDVIYINPVCK